MRGKGATIKEIEMKLFFLPNLTQTSLFDSVPQHFTNCVFVLLIWFLGFSEISSSY